MCSPLSLRYCTAQMVAIIIVMINLLGIGSRTFFFFFFFVSEWPERVVFTSLGSGSVLFLSEWPEWPCLSLCCAKTCQTLTLSYRSGCVCVVQKHARH